jgi:hypothetical protein
MRTRILKTLSVVAAVSLIATLVVFALPFQSEAAAPRFSGQAGLTAPITVISSKPGLTIAAFEGTGLNAAGTPAGTFEGASLVPSDGKDLTMFVPVGMTTSLYAWDSTGYKLIGTVTPLSSADKTAVTADAAGKA